MIVLLAGTALLLLISSLTNSAKLDSEILDGIETGEMMDFMRLPQPPTILKVENTGRKRNEGRIRILGKRKEGRIRILGKRIILS